MLNISKHFIGCSLQWNAILWIIVYSVKVITTAFYLDTYVYWFGIRFPFSHFLLVPVCFQKLTLQSSIVSSSEISGPTLTVFHTLKRTEILIFHILLWNDFWTVRLQKALLFFHYVSVLQTVVSIKIFLICLWAYQNRKSSKKLNSECFQHVSDDLMCCF